MDVERTIEFLLKNQVRMDARLDAKFAKAEKRFDRIERVFAQNNRIVARLARHGVSLRSDVRRIDKALAEVAERQARTEEKLAETDEKLNALIVIVDRSIRRNGRGRGPVSLEAQSLSKCEVPIDLGDHLNRLSVQECGRVAPADDGMHRRLPPAMGLRQGLAGFEFSAS
jgi:hypothetical protein